MSDFFIVHIEDDAPQWKPITSSLAAAIAEHLSEWAPEAFATLKHTPPPTPNIYPACTTIVWQHAGVTHTVHYWFVDTVGVESIAAELQRAAGNATFVLDVMRKKRLEGLQSSLPETLASIRKYVSNEGDQVRLFTAYSETDEVEFPAEHPLLFKKGIETRLLLNFLLLRIGFGRQ